MQNLMGGKINKLLRHRFFLPVLLFIVSTIFYISNIDGQGLSLDEGETVAVGKAIFKYGIPASWDGVNMLAVSGGMEYKLINGIYVWRWHPWLQHYLFALSLPFSSGNILYGRIPFAMTGALTVVALYGVSQYIFRNKFISSIVSLHLLFLFPFFLYVRQIRYYAPSALLGVIAFFFLLVLFKNKWKKSYLLPFFVTTVLLFFANYVTWGTTCLFLGGMSLYRKRYDLLFVLFLEAVIGVVWFFILQPYNGNVLLQTVHSAFFSKVISISSYVNSYIFPFLLFPLILVFKKNRKLIIFILLFIVVKFLIYQFLYYKHGRYLIDLFPIFVFLFGFFYYFLLRKKKYFFILMLFFVTCFTNVFSAPVEAFFKDKAVPLRFYPREFYIELSSQYTSALEPLAAYLKGNYRKGDLFYASDRSWDIYNLSGVPLFYPGCSEQNLKEVPPSVRKVENIRWIIFVNTPVNFSGYFGATCTDKNLYMQITGQYERIRLNLGDTYSINDPDVAIRDFPPYEVHEDYIVLFEKK